MPRTQLAGMAIPAVVFLLTTAGPAAAQAQDIRWRHDYAAARREATETGRPLLLDFGTEACFWCKKLDSTTFRDPKIAKLIDERFIAVKIDGDKHPRLVEALGIESFPTLVLATPDGKVIGRHEGYADVAQMTALLAKPQAASPPVKPAPAPVPDPDADRRRAKEQIDADLAALAPRIAASLGR